MLQLSASSGVHAAVDVDLGQALEHVVVHDLADRRGRRGRRVEPRRRLEHHADHDAVLAALRVRGARERDGGQGDQEARAQFHRWTPVGDSTAHSGSAAPDAASCESRSAGSGGIGCGTAASSARVYGCSAWRNSRSGEPRSTIRPSRITTTSSHTMLDDREVVADEQVGDAEVALQIGHQVEHLRLHRHVERADRLVGDDELRPRDQRARDRDALALAAGELVRVLVHVGRAQADRLERLRDTLALRLAVGTADRGQRLGDDAPDALARIERAERILEHHLELRARGLQLVGRQDGAGRAPRTAPRPLVGGSSAITSRASVDLPEPDSPTTPRLRPACSVKLTPSSACTSGGGSQQALARQAVDARDVVDFEQRQAGLTAALSQRERVGLSPLGRGGVRGRGASSPAPGH